MKISMTRFAFALAAATNLANAEFPVTYKNCHLEFTVTEAPQRAVSLNQGTTEMLLGLGLEDNMAGTAYLDDAIWPEFEDAYNKVPVLEESAYPNIATLMEADPDFIYASYRSAFEARTEGGSQSRIEYYDWLPVDECELTIEGTGDRADSTYCRAELAEAGVPSYLQTPSCEIQDFRPEELTLDELYQEINDIASIFGAEENAVTLIDTIEEHFRDAQALADGASSAAGEPVSVLFLDSWSDETPFVGACCGSINAIIEYAGAVNVYKDLGLEERSTWARTNWTDIAEKDPDVIIVVDASWDKADEKLYNLCNNDLTRNLSAVQNRRFITIPFSATTLGVRIGSLAFNLAEAVTALMQNGNTPLSSLQFTDVSLSEAGNNGEEALGKSGAIVYTRLPIVNDVDLETFCPGGKSQIFIGDILDTDTAVTDAVTVADDSDPQTEDVSHDSHDDHDHGDDCHCDADGSGGFEVHCSDPAEEAECHCHDGEAHCDHDDETTEGSKNESGADHDTGLGFLGSLAVGALVTAAAL